MFVIRSFTFLLLCAFLTADGAEQPGSLDPDFAKIPFDQWINEKEQTHFHWKAAMLHPELSFHQRMMSQLEIQVDGKDLQSRRGDGNLVFLVQITDRNETRYQTHSKVELSKLDPDIKAADLNYSHKMFLLPGEYRVAVAILYTATGEHSVRQLKLHVDTPENDLLKRAWRDLPAVEFQGKADSPDSWFLPDIQGRLQWAGAVRTAARVNILLNVAPAAMEPEQWRPISRGMGRYGTYPPSGTNGSGPVREHNGTSVEMAALIPTLKALTQTGSPSISENVALLDLSRRRTVFEQKDVRDLDWPRLKASLGQASTASIDVHALSDRTQDAQYFVSEVRRMVRASQNGCTLVVLTNPVSFEKGVDLEPISTEALPACHIFYIRYHTLIQHQYQNSARMIGRRGHMGGGPLTTPVEHEASDQLEGTLKPLGPKVHDVSMPDQLLKAFVEIERELGQ